ncbi:hypothetical protein C8Q75DRAFT_802120 [Abortiporus biennis]|nr:hypothetical protein C8Q75DRAFT_802120 [Abortiporus biennis]
MDPIVQTVGNREVISKYAYKTREPATRAPHSHVKQSNKPQLTPTEKVEQKVRTDNKWTQKAKALEEAHHTICDLSASLHDYFPETSKEDWHSCLLQSSKKILTQIFLQVLPNIERSVAKEFHPYWLTLSEDEKKKLVGDQPEVLEEQQAIQTFGQYNSSLAAFHDTHTSLQDISQRVMKLHAHTGMEVLFLATRSKTTDFNQPYTYTTSPKFEKFFHFMTGCDLQTFTLRSEAYHISGVQGIVDTGAQEVNKLKSATKDFIYNKLHKFLPIFTLCPNS